MLRFILASFWRHIRLAFRIVRYTLGVIIFLFLIQRSSYPVYLESNVVASFVRDYQFDYVTWEINAIWAKAKGVLFGQHPYLDEETRSQFVREYFADLARVVQLESQIETIFVDPAVDDPQTASMELRAQRDSLRDDLKDRQTLIESILEGQVAAVLVDEGFGTLGQLLPPISMRFSQTPNLLVVSPRDSIHMDIALNLDPMPLEEIVAVERRILDERNLSALVVPIGGVAVYPAMIKETTNLRWAIETFSHEWSHHYLFFYPLGLNYEFDGEARIINETVADVFGKEIAEEVLARYYPEVVASGDSADGAIVLASDHQQSSFDFGSTMNETRVTVDQYMAGIGVIESKMWTLSDANQPERAASYQPIVDYFVLKAETYMEHRRAIFVANGYNIRKINQAYFAFYGGYQGGIAGVGGEDPIGPAVQEIRALSPDAHRFMVVMRGITDRAELLAVRDAMRRQS